jgi:hypothetical protein
MRFPLYKGLGWGLDIPEISSILFGSLEYFTMELATRITIGLFTRTYSKCILEDWA